MSSGHATPADTRLGDYHAAHRFVQALSQQEEGKELPRIKDYAIVERVASGGQGDVFLAAGRSSGEPLAIKVYHHQLTTPSAAARAWREIDLLRRLRLPFVPRVHDYGVANGRAFVVMDFVQGTPLDGLSLPRDEAVDLIIELCERVQQLHEHGILHRDLKPSAIIVDASGEPIIIDFGIAFLIDEDSTLTNTTTPIGTLAFMAPEQAAGERDRLSTRTDVYGLAATAFFALTGQPPHDQSGPLHERVRRAAQDRPRDLVDIIPDTPRPLARIIAKALSHDPANRHASAALLAEDLRRWRRGEPIAWTRPPRLQVLRYWVRQNPKTALATSTAALALTAAIVAGSVAIIASNRAARHETAVGNILRIVQRAVDRGDFGGAAKMLGTVNEAVQHAPPPENEAEHVTETNIDYVLSVNKAMFTELMHDDDVRAASADALIAWLRTEFSQSAAIDTATNGKLVGQE